MTESNENSMLEGEEPENTEVKGTEMAKFEVTETTESEITDVIEVKDSLTTTKEEKSKEQNEKTKTQKNKRKCSSKKWTCDDENVWRNYMMSFIEKYRRLKRADKPKEKNPAALPGFSQLVSSENIPQGLKCFPLNTFHQNYKANLLRELTPDDKADILSSLQQDVPKLSKNISKIWPGTSPYIKRKLAEEWKHIEKITKSKRMGVLPCLLETEDISEYGPNDDYISHKGLGHARIPRTHPKIAKYLMVDRAAGENPGLVDGDYILLEFSSKKKGKRIYADVCLRGLKGMHIVELSPRREREKTWKFCFYQAVVALLAKTQLRYKLAWSVNVDYIYDHAWMLFLHMGYINIRKNQRFDDIVVYNYKYGIELELIHELKEIPRITDVNSDFEEKTLKKQEELERKELMHTSEVIGSEKNSITQKLLVHKTTKEIEDWFDKLDLQNKNCVFRTTRFALAFWKDGLYWYLYNPFRCDQFGLWNDCGYGCIMKFCSRESLKRHLMILLLRAYVYEAHLVVNEDGTDEQENGENEHEGQGGGKKKCNTFEGDIPNEGDGDRENQRENSSNPDGLEEESELKKDVFTIQIFQMTYHCCEFHNIKLLQRGVPKQKLHSLPKNELYACPVDSDELSDSCVNEEEKEFDICGREKLEKQSWLKSMRITWARLSSTEKEKNEKDIITKKLKWHHYYVEEEGKLFSLWGQVHIKDPIFPVENRGKQCNACYVIFAGMTKLMAPEYWSPRTLDAILFCGDGYYTSSVLEAEEKSRKPEYVNVECWNNYLSEYFKIGELLFQVRVLPEICGKIYVKSNRYLWKTLEQFFLKYRFGILTCENVCLGISKYCEAYYIFDAHSFGPPLFQYGTGNAYMLRATYFFKFITILIITIGSPECSQFSLNPIEILQIHDLNNVNGPGKNHKEIFREIK
ncbi:uncharacterized protein LOC117179071 [Belonocnema kinseyi]|uniref:uncharacterized protein LOC117179071 n=1 Tax=Belonocnema kinseyi TaxID=2817044 RepID=UPI00143DCD94|nr:uncharacterized protein LOC117179071 [Belonocnema kinseyi]